VLLWLCESCLRDSFASKLRLAMNVMTLQRATDIPLDVSAIHGPDINALIQPQIGTGPIRFRGRLEIPGAPF
jgi:hypothetical protein